MHRIGRRFVAGLALLAAAGCATSTAGNGEPAGGLAGGPAPSTATGGDPSGSPTGGPTGDPADPTSSPSGDPGTGATPAGKSLAFGKIRIVLTPGTTARADGGLLCLTVQGDDGCTLEVMDIGEVRAAGGSVSFPVPGTPNGWWWGSDVPSCGDADRYVEVTRSSVVESGFKKVGPRTAEYGSWLVTCEDGDLDFDPRLWWLPASQIAFRSHTSVAGRGEAVDKLLAGVTFS